MSEASRREFLGMLAASAALPLVRHAHDLRFREAPRGARPLRIRTITAGIGLSSAGDRGRVESAIAVLDRGRKLLESEGYEVQTVRVATSPFMAEADDRARDEALTSLQALDGLASARGALLAIGPVLTADRPAPHLAAWAAELLRTTKNLSFTVRVASSEGGAAPHAATAAAETMAAVARATPNGLGNFRFAAAANVPPGTPFFPVAYHHGPDAIAVGLESASLVEEAAADGGGGARLRERLDEALAPVARTGGGVRAAGGASVPGHRSVARAGERPQHRGGDRGPHRRALRQRLHARGLRHDHGRAQEPARPDLRVRRSHAAGAGRSGAREARRARAATACRTCSCTPASAGPGSTSCPLPGDTPVEVLARIIRDVATLSARLRKPLSARLFLVPGKAAGEVARFDDPYLTDSVVMAVR